MSRAARRWRIGIDVGGTFTDLVAVPGDGTGWDLGRAITHKVASTPDDPSAGVEQGLAQLLARGVDVRDVASVTHGTTIGLNALLQGRVARAALVTSRGHRDVLQIARARLPRSFDLHTAPPRPIVPREHVVEIDLRFGPDGASEPYDEPGYRATLARLVELDPAVVTVSLLGAYAAPAAELALAQALAADLRRPVTAAATVWPQAGEYERTALALLDAQITPLMSGYFTALRDRLVRLGVTAHLYISTSNGGSVSLDSAVRQPIQTVLSGPAAGVGAAAHMWPGLDVVTVDMGGTSSDIGLLRGGETVLSTSASIGPHPLMMPVVEVSAIGAGGGSVVRADPSGARTVLRVGPASVGAVPGPAAYGAGGREAALTDVYVHAGVIDPDNFLGGTLSLRADLATGALARVAADLGSASGPDEVLDGALRVASAGMAARLRTVLASHGEVPETFVFVAYGGAGGTHAALLADEVGVRHVIVPATAATFCAVGAAIAPVRRDFARTLRADVDAQSMAAVSQACAELVREAGEWLVTQGVRGAGEVSVGADLRYAGQPTTVEVTLAQLRTDGATEPPVRLTAQEVRARFDSAHAGLHGFTDPTATVRVETVRVNVVGPRNVVASGDVDGVFQRTGARPVRYAGAWERTDVFRLGTPADVAADGPAPGAAPRTVCGPAVVEKPDTTVLVPSGWGARIDATGNLHLERDPAKEAPC